MSKSVTSKLAASRKWLEKNAQAGLNLKTANAVLASAEKAAGDLAGLKAKMAEATAAKATALRSLDDAMARVRTEKKLKAKEARLQMKLAALASPA
jgi:hypothetical protein